MKRYFLFLYPEEPPIRKLLDLAIFVLNPKEKHAAHVTLAGPYQSLRNVPRDTTFIRKVSLLGVGQFRSDWQNTVFLHVGAEDLRLFWDKPDFPYNPHLTLYDGEDGEFATRLYERLHQTRLFLKFHVSRVHVVEVIKGQGSMSLLQSLDFDVAPEMKGMSVTDVRALSPEERLLLGSDILARAKYESNRL
jgi:hypothetical protein